MISTPSPTFSLEIARDPVCDPVSFFAFAPLMDPAPLLPSSPSARLRLEVAVGVGHEATPAMLAAAGAWLDLFLLAGPEEAAGGRPRDAAPETRCLVTELVVER